ncbi:transcription elongation factor GreA [Aureliella helgolandensis]|uniref:Transcription elongation factor GreA n=1 Tax=Aureliella helgolandensis TaxID=2527968 RepID=A0A518G006_9BACT|nr:transcription elongation factor GreA [Aureliella helgolandensis]QDV21942.1 Transcription elongation factor GreA [Aureliella helgolandensis]
MSEMVPMTREKYNQLRAEVDQLENVDMPLVTEKIAEARAEGDLKENAEYHAQRENQGMLQAKINQKKMMISNAYIIDPSKLPKDEVGLLSTVKVKDLDYDDEEEFTMVGAGDEDYDKGRILSTSPIGAALMGCKIGDKVEIDVPKGKLKFEILAIEYR